MSASKSTQQHTGLQAMDCLHLCVCAHACFSEQGSCGVCVCPAYFVCEGPAALMQPSSRVDSEEWGQKKLQTAAPLLAYGQEKLQRQPCSHPPAACGRLGFCSCPPAAWVNHRVLVGDAHTRTHKVHTCSSCTTPGDDPGGKRSRSRPCASGSHARAQAGSSRPC